MKLKGGLRKDERFIDMPNGSWVDARNILLQKGFQSVSNEKGNVESLNLEGLSICGVIPTPLFSIIYSTDSNGISEIGILDDENNYTIKIHDSASLFNFNIQNPIDGVFKFNHNGDIIVAWCDGINDTSQSPKLLNLTNLPFEVDGDLELVDPNDINLAKLFPNVKVPEIIIDNVNAVGGQLKAGDYYLIIAYEIENNDLTNFLFPSRPIAVATVVEETSPTIFPYNDTAPGLSTSVSIDLTINNLDLTFDFFRLISVKKLAGVVTAEEIGRFPTNNQLDINGNGKYTYSYTGKEVASVISLESVFVNNFIFDKVKAISDFENRLILGNFTTSDILDYQKYANNIIVKYQIEEVADFAELKDYVDYRSFMPEEVYAKYIHFVMLNGTVSNGFHIPGRPVREFKALLYRNWAYTFGSTIGSTTQLIGAVGTVEPDFNGIDVSQGYYITINGNIYPVEEILTDGINDFIHITSASFSESSTGILNLYVGSLYDTGAGYAPSNKLENDLTGSGGLGGEALSISAEEQLISPSLKYYQILDTADEPDSNNQGLMGYWENENEFYPDTDDFDIWGVDGDGEPVNLTESNPITYPTLRNTRVRHHKMPSQNRINGGNDTIKARTISLRFDNIQIPNEIESRIQGYYITYVKKDFNNISIISNDAVFESRVTSGYATTYYFPLLTSKPTLSPTYIKHIATINNADDILNYPSFIDNIRRIKDVEYHPENNSATIPDNSGQEENISFKYTNGANWSADTSLNSGDGSYGKIALMNMVNYFKDVYVPFNNQQDLCSTGKLYYTNGSNVYSTLLDTIPLYGGDTFVNRTFNRLLIIPGLTKSIFPYYSYSPYNIAFREKDIAAWSSYAFNHYQYNQDLSSLLDIKQTGSNNPFIVKVNKFPYRIHRSNIGAEESVSIGWRTFPVNSYFEMTKNKGEIWKLAYLNKELLIHLKYSLFSAKSKDRLTNDGTETFLGASDIFDREPDEIITTKFGYTGNQSQWAAFVCEAGYIFIDRQQGKIFIYDGRIDEISDKGLRNFFKANLNTETDIDNPFNNNGITAGYDEDNNRIIICKKEVILVETNIGTEEEPELVDIETDIGFTISYSVRDKIWICKHDYFPNFIFNNRNTLYFVNNTFEGGITAQILKHNIGDNGKFKDVIYKSYIDVIFKIADKNSKIFDAVTWMSDIITSTGVNLKDRTITQIMVYNTTQNSGEITINTLIGSWFSPNCRNVQETWQFNDFRDVVKDRTLPILNSENQLIPSNINNNKNWFDKSLFIDKFIIVRFIYDNLVNNDIYITDVNVLIRESNR